MPRRSEQITAQWLSERVRDLMRDRHWESDSAYLLHKRSGISERYAATILAGAGPNRPRRETLEKLAAAFDVSIDEFLGEGESTVEVVLGISGPQQDVLNAIAMLDRESLNNVIASAVDGYVEQQRLVPRVKVMLDALERARGAEERTVVPLPNEQRSSES